MFDFFSKEDKQLYNMLGHLNMAEKEISLKDNSETEIYEVVGPDDKYAFLHEAAIIEYHGNFEQLCQRRKGEIFCLFELVGRKNVGCRCLRERA